MQHRRISAVIAPGIVLACFLPAVGLADAPYNTPGPTVKVGAETVLYTPQGTDLAQFPGLHSLDLIVDGQPAKRLMATWSTAADDPTPEPGEPGSGGGVRSDDGGATWPHDISGEGPSSWIRLADNTLFGVAFDTKMLPITTPPQDTGTQEEVYSYLSTDASLTWTKTTGILQAPAGHEFKTTNAGSGRGGLLFHRSLWQANDGAIYGTFYGGYVGDTSGRTAWVKTTDMGKTWSVINSSMGTGGTNEAAAAQCTDGSLYAAMRGPASYPDHPHPWLYVTRSTDGGVTWSPQTRLTIAGDANVRGVDPELRLLPNGVLVLSSGRPDNWVAISTDCGTTWTNKTITYEGADFPQTTGYTGLGEVQAHQVLQAYDTGGSQEEETPQPNPYSIRYKPITILRGLVQRIDLNTKYAQGLITVDTNMTYTDAAIPVCRPQGAFDGSSYYWASAFQGNTTEPGVYIIHLDKAYTITDLGIMLKRGYPETAAVYVSTDGGTSWGKAVQTYTDATHYGIDYTSFDTPIENVNAVKVEVTSPQRFGGLNEIELYTDHDTFENDGDGTLPTYYANATSSGVSVSDRRGYQSQKSLRISDSSTTDLPSITKISPPSQTKTIAMQVYPQALPHGFTFNVRANTTAGNDIAFQLGVFTGGTLHYYDGTSWVRLAGAGTVPMGTWSTLQIIADLSTAQIYVNDVLQGTAHIWAESGKTLARLTGLGLGTHGTPQTGDEVYIDNINLP